MSKESKFLRLKEVGECFLMTKMLGLQNFAYSLNKRRPTDIDCLLIFCRMSTALSQPPLVLLPNS